MKNLTFFFILLALSLQASNGSAEPSRAWGARSQNPVDELWFGADSGISIATLPVDAPNGPFFSGPRVGPGPTLSNQSLLGFEVRLPLSERSDARAMDWGSLDLSTPFRN